ncbi:MULTISPECIES: dermonecrotic toxin domain-containing protein [unclassified Pseudomonas]|uniref:dermonecrotic toxin domain-containing protein n=1 Tax=unclassified Pseudomonas TaxID=196821 RepID=UPI000C88AEA6|nr:MULTISPECIES: DUF6543 domain-containing protein [unclassified Pseudomonas]PNA03714.1 hypothetical protein C1X28_19700 [Pseudomonas sp. FW305-BF15]PNB78704.1 hypothetical protein C1X30_22275 [Pseudomonas sp. FW305-BF6]
MSETFQPDSSSIKPSRQHVSRSIHAATLEQSIPDWLTEAASHRRASLRNANAILPDWYRKASSGQRNVLNESFTASFRAQTRLDHALADMQGIHVFGKTLLCAMLKDRFNVELDVEDTFLQLIQPINAGIWSTEIGTFEVSKMSLLQAALHNFEAAECENGAFHKRSGFLARLPAGTFKAVRTSMSVRQFMVACRTLDIGGQYQRYLKHYLYSENQPAHQTLRELFTTARRAALHAAAEQALLQGDIEPADHASIQEILHGERQPLLGGRRIWFCEMSLMRRRLTGCLWFAISERFEDPEELILYIPDDPHHPLKRYKTSQLEAALKRRFTARESASADDGTPTPYQRFFSRFVAYADRAYYFSQFTDNAPDASFSSRVTSYLARINDWINGLSPLPNTLVDLVPPAPAIRQVANQDPFLAPVNMPFKGLRFWDDNIDLWDYLFERHREQLLEDARSYAVPVEDVDANARKTLFAKLLNSGMLVLNTVSMLVPVLGEVMMGVMACQLLEESIEGVIEWSEGDRHAATAHLVDIASNLALIALMGGVTKGVTRLKPVDAAPVIEDLHPVTRPDGHARLRKSDLGGYESTVRIDPGVRPDALGRYEIQGRHFIRIEGKTYEQVYDRALGRWCIRYPDNPHAYQPVLTHNAAGAWRHTLENPLKWSRQTLLRRIGHITEAYTDEQLLTIGEISGVSDNALRKMHMDNLSPPPELMDALRLFDTDRGVVQVIEQLAGDLDIDHRYLHALPLIIELPGWPVGRILKVYDTPDFTGPSTRYGSEHPLAEMANKPPIRLSRSHVLNGELPARILSALDESEISALFGDKEAGDRVWRPQAFRDLLADYARANRPTLFESLFQESAIADPMIDRLQRAYAGLSDAAAQEILRHANADDMAILYSTGRMPDAMLEEARWYARRGRLVRALAGLHMEHMMSADTRRLALHTLSKLPGWSADMQLDIRDGRVDGRQIDSIGHESAAVRRSVVKKGPVYQAFNEHGVALNELPVSGNGFYASVLRLLPEDVRKAIGLSEAAHGSDLQRAITAYATEHAGDTATMLALHGRRTLKFKPPQRIREHLVGYYASGEGAVGLSGLNPSLVVRLLSLYPDLSISRANGVLLKMIRTGKSDAHILQLLEDLRHQWLELEQTLDHWANTGPNRAQKDRIATRLKRCWRKRPFAEENPTLRHLDLATDEALPGFSADFSHVTVMRLQAPHATLGQMRGFLRNFPELEFLDLSGNHLVTNPIPRECSARLLELDLSDNPVSRLDVTGMWRLELLDLKGTRLQEWPLGADNLRNLRWLDLSNTLISDIPRQALARDEWVLNMNLTGTPLTDDARLQLRVAQQRCELALDLPQGSLAQFMLEDVPEQDSRPLENGTLVAGRLMRIPTPIPFTDHVPAFTRRLRRVHPSLTEEKAEEVAEGLLQDASVEQVNARIEDWNQRLESMTRQLNGWIFTRRSGNTLFGGHWSTSQGRREASLRIMECWRKGLLGASARSDRTLDLANISRLGTLPRLSPEFAHVEGLSLRGLGLSGADVQEFLQAFSRIRWLDLGLNELSAVPSVIAGMERLEELGLIGNRFNDFPAVVDALGPMPRLKWLKLNYNRLTVFNGVTAEQLPALRWLELSFNHMRQFNGPVSATLEVLHLNGNDLREWPEGVLQAERLLSLNLEDNPIREIPPRAFDGNHDVLLAGTRMSPNWRSLMTDSLIRLRAHLDRVGGEQVLGIKRETLDFWLTDTEFDQFVDWSGSESEPEEDVR